MHKIEAAKEQTAVINELLLSPNAVKLIMAILAPSAEAAEMPIVEGEAKGLFKEDCIIMPDNARPIPTKKPPKIRGSLMLKTINLLLSLPLPNKVRILSITVISEEPTLIDIIEITAKAIPNININKSLFAILRLYCLLKSIGALNYPLI